MRVRPGAIAHAGAARSKVRQERRNPVAIGWRREKDAEKSNIAARVSETQAQRQAVAHVLDRVFAGSAGKLVLQALAARRTSPEERAEIRKLLDEMEGGKQ